MLYSLALASGYRMNQNGSGQNVPDCSRCAGTVEKGEGSGERGQGPLHKRRAAHLKSRDGVCRIHGETPELDSPPTILDFALLVKSGKSDRHTSGRSEEGRLSV
jgi:hypothetical protein